MSRTCLQSNCDGTNVEPKWYTHFHSVWPHVRFWLMLICAQNWFNFSISSITTLNTLFLVSITAKTHMLLHVEVLIIVTHTDYKLIFGGSAGWFSVFDSFSWNPVILCICIYLFGLKNRTLQLIHLLESRCALSTLRGVWDPQTNSLLFQSQGWKRDGIVFHITDLQEQFWSKCHYNVLKSILKWICCHL